MLLDSRLAAAGRIPPDAGAGPGAGARHHPPGKQFRPDHGQPGRRARGLMQLMPATASWWRGSWACRAGLPALTADPRLNIRLGTAYLRGIAGPVRRQRAAGGRRLQCRAEPGAPSGSAAMATRARRGDRHDRLDRADPVRRDAQLRAAGDREPGDLPRQARRGDGRIRWRSGCGEHRRLSLPPCGRGPGWGFDTHTRGRMTLARLIASGFGLGRCPGAPGTLGLAARPCSRAPGCCWSRHWLLRWPRRRWRHSAGSGRSAPPGRGAGDPGWVVIDEVAGQWITMLGLARPALPGLAAAFLLFRAARYHQARPDRLGRPTDTAPLAVMADDVIAGAIGAALLLAAARPPSRGRCDEMLPLRPAIAPSWPRSTHRRRPTR